VGVATYDDVDLGRQLASEVDDLPATLGRSVSSAIRAGVSNYDNEVGAAFSQRGSNAVYNGSGIVETKSDNVGSTGSSRRRYS